MTAMTVVSEIGLAGWFLIGVALGIFAGLIARVFRG
jgi:hypothetical protein